MICSLSNFSYCKEKIEKTSSFITHSQRQRWGIRVDVWESRLVGKSIMGFGALSCLLLVLFSDLLISLFEPTTEVTLKANSYLILRSIGLPFYLLNMHSTAVLRGMKHPKITLYSSIIVGVSNVILSFVLAVVFDFGIQGIALNNSLNTDRII